VICTKKINILVLSKYGDLGASSRLRMFQYLPLLESSDFKFSVHSLISNNLVIDRYQHGKYQLGSLLLAYANRVLTMVQRYKFDLIWIEKEALPWLPLWIEKLLLGGTPYVLDYDDAIFHHYDSHRLAIVRYFLGQRIDGLMANAALVIGGNQYLVQRARCAGSLWVEILPTVLDIDRYRCKAYSTVLAMGEESSTGATSLPCIVWIGSPTTSPYVEDLRDIFLRVAQKQPFCLRVIGGLPFNVPGVSVEYVAWSEATEAEWLRSADIGIMPLTDTQWERGKCGYKLIQYMASGLPVVASAVGANRDIVIDDINGYLASSPDQWSEYLIKLLQSSELRGRLGLAGRQRVESLYCVQQIWSKLALLLKRAAEKSRTE